VVVQRPHAAECPNDVVRADRPREVGVGNLAQVVDFAARNLRCFEIVHGDVGRSDQGEIVFVRDDEDDAGVRILQDVRVVLGVHTRDDDMTAFDVPYVRFGGGGAHFEDLL